MLKTAARVILIVTVLVASFWNAPQAVETPPGLLSPEWSACPERECQPFRKPCPEGPNPAACSRAGSTHRPSHEPARSSDRSALIAQSAASPDPRHREVWLPQYLKVYLPSTPGNRRAPPA